MGPIRLMGLVGELLNRRFYRQSYEESGGLLPRFALAIGCGNISLSILGMVMLRAGFFQYRNQVDFLSVSVLL